MCLLRPVTGETGFFGFSGKKWVGYSANPILPYLHALWRYIIPPITGELFSPYSLEKPDSPPKKSVPLKNGSTKPFSDHIAM